MPDDEPVPANVRTLREPGESSICIVGVARNCGKTIERDVSRLKTATARFARRNIFVVESDSSDGTIGALERMRAEDPAFQFETCGTLADTMPLRTQRIAHCRNRTVDFVRALPNNEADFVLVADLDGINGAIDETSLLSCWKLGVDWDVCTANRLGRYYDIFALRCPGWVDEDCALQTRKLAARLSPALARHLSTEARMIVIPSDHDPIPVDSAFGGLSVYRGDAYQIGHYVGLDERGEETCEHVQFHRDLRQTGAAIFINPRMVAGGRSEFPGKDMLRALRTMARL